MTCTKFFAFTVYDTNTDFMQFPPTNNRGEYTKIKLRIFMKKKLKIMPPFVFHTLLKQNDSVHIECRTFYGLFHYFNTLILPSNLQFDDADGMTRAMNSVT